MRKSDGIIAKKMLAEATFLQDLLGDKTLEELQGDEVLKRAAAMCLINIGELANHFSPEFKKAYGDIPYRGMVDLRNAAAHGYYVLKIERVWKTIKDEIPKLRDMLVKI